MALAVRAAQTTQRKTLIISSDSNHDLWAMFLGVKAFEYHEKYVEHLIPGPYFQYTEAPQFAHQAQILFFLYFAMTGMHAVHMIVGLGLLTYLLIQAYRYKFSAPISPRLK